MLIASKRFFLSKKKKLPYDAEVEYLESTGTQYIDLALNSTTDKFYDFEISFALKSSTATIPFGYAYGATARYGMWNSGSNWFVGANNSNQLDAGARDTNWHDVRTHFGSNVVVDGVSYPIGGGSVRTNIGLNLFARVSSQYGASSRNTSQAKVSKFKIWDTDGNLLRDLIPVRVGSAGYMYDKVSGRLFGNAGTGDFVLGPDIVEVEYLENPDLTQYIDTGVIGGEGLRVQTNILPIEKSNDKWAIGSYDDNARLYVAYQYRTGKPGYWGGGYGYYFQGTDDTAMSFDTFQNLDVEFTSTEQILRIDGVEKARWEKFRFTGIVASPLWLFGRSGTSNISSFRCKIGKTKIWMNGVLVRDYIPVIVGGEGAMMDRLTRKIYRNSGTGKFKVGPIVGKATARSYVQDGLVAQWDGIENVALGQHGASATTWADLTNGGRNASLTQHGSFGVNALICDGIGYAAKDGSAISRSVVQCVEVVYTPLSDGIIAVLANAGSSTDNGGIRISKVGTTLYGMTVNSVGAGLKNYVTITSPGTTALSFLYSDTDMTGAWVNGTSVSPGYKFSSYAATNVAFGGRSENNDVPFKGSIHSVRIYSRALTAEEIETNNLIDKARFNLP